MQKTLRFVMAMSDIFEIDYYSRVQPELVSVPGEGT